MFKYLLILAACIGFPIYLYFNQEHTFPLTSKYHDTSGKEVSITIVAQSENFVHFIHSKDNKYIGQDKTYILSHKHFPNELTQSLEKYPKNFTFAEFPCVLEFTTRSTGNKLATFTGKNSVFAYYHDRGTSRIESIAISSLDHSTQELLEAFPKSRNDRAAKALNSVKIPWNTTLETTNGTRKAVSIYKRSAEHVLLSIDEKYNLYKYPTEKLTLESSKKLENLPLSPPINEDIDAIKNRYQFTLKQLRSKEKRLTKYKRGTFQHKAVLKEIDKIQDEVTLAKNKLHRSMGL